LLPGLDEMACLLIPFRKRKETLSTIVDLLSISGCGALTFPMPATGEEHRHKPL